MSSHNEISKEVEHFRQSLEHLLDVVSSPNCEKEGCSNLIRESLSEYDKFSRMLLENEQEENDFVLLISHNLRQAAEVLGGATQMLKTTQLSSNQNNYSNFLSLGTSSLQSVIDDLLAYVQLKVGRMKVHHHPFCLRSVLEEIVGFYSARLNGGKVSLFFRYPDNVPDEIVADSNRICQIVKTLMELAVSQTIEGHVSLTVKWNPDSDRPLRIEVTDTGFPSQLDLEIGAPSLSSDLAVISVEKNSNEISLRICRKIVELIEGHFSMTSSEGYGNRYVIDCAVTVKDSARNNQTVELSGIEHVYISTANDVLGQQINNAVSSFGLPSSSISDFSNFSELLGDGKIGSKNCVFFDIASLGRAAKVKNIIKTIRPDFHPFCVVVGKTEELEKLGDVSDYGFFDKIEEPLFPSKIAVILDKISSLKDVSTKDNQSQYEQAESLGEYCRVLLVEDNRFNAFVLEKLLKRISCSVTIAYDGLSAIECVENDDFDIILMDCLLPGISGFTTAERIAKLPNRSSIPIIAITANSDQRTRKLCMDAGMVDFLGKPVQLSVLRTTIERWVHDQSSGKSEEIYQSKSAQELLEYSDPLYQIVLKTFREEVDTWTQIVWNAISENDTFSLIRALYYFRSTFSLLGKEDAFVLFRDLEERVKVNKWREVDLAKDVIRDHIDEGINLCTARLAAMDGFELSDDKKCIDAVDPIGVGNSMIIVLDSDPVTWSLFKYFERVGLKALWAKDLDEARSIVGDVGLQNISCAVCSDNTGTSDPLAFQQFFRLLDPLMSTILYSHHPDKELVNSVSNLGMTELLPKPLPCAKIIQSIVQGIKNTSRRRVLRETQLAAKKMGSSQLNLLSSSFRNKDSLKTDVSYHPKQEAGGDFFVKLKLSEEHHILLMTDVSGHDLEAAFVSAYFQGMIRGSVLEGGQCLEHALKSFNSMLLNEWNVEQDNQEYVDKSIVTCAVSLNKTSDKAEFHLAGSCIPIVVRDDRLMAIADKTGTPLGWFEEPLIETRSVDLKSIDEFYVWSDGVEAISLHQGVNVMSMVTTLLSYQQKNQRPEWIIDIEDDLLVIRSSYDCLFEDKTVFPLFYEEYVGTDHSRIDEFQQIWDQSLKFLCRSFPEELLYNILLCSREALLNKLKHGCEGREDRRARMSMRIDIERGVFIVEIEDDGIGFDVDHSLKKEKSARSHCGTNLIQVMSMLSRYDKSGNKINIEFDAKNLPIGILSYETDHAAHK